MNRFAILAYGGVCYLVFLISFGWALAFIGNIGIQNSISAPPRCNVAIAVTINVSLIGLFALQHSLMARPAFKAWLNRRVPESSERSTYVLFSSLALMLLLWQWQPIGGQVWLVERTWLVASIYATFFVGWGLLFYATCLLGHFELFGVAQCWRAFTGQERKPDTFRTPSLYRFVRHPIYVGWLIAMWATPNMTLAHWLFALGLTAPILVAVQFEERDLEASHGDHYRQYRRRVPMLLPGFALGRRKETKAMNG